MDDIISKLDAPNIINNNKNINKNIDNEDLPITLNELESDKIPYNDNFKYNQNINAKNNNNYINKNNNSNNNNNQRQLGGFLETFNPVKGKQNQNNCNNYEMNYDNSINNNNPNEQYINKEQLSQMSQMHSLQNSNMDKRINNNNIVNNINNNLINISNINNYNNNINNINNNQNIINNNQDNQSILSGSGYNQKFQSQLKLIEEKSESKRLEEEAKEKEIKEIENQLRIDQRLTHDNREIRKNACRELTEMCLEYMESNENNNNPENASEKLEFYECFSPWVKYCIEQTNAYVLPEALNYFYTFNSVFVEQNNNSLKDFFDNIERLISFGINSITELCKNIIYLFLKNKKLLNNTINELIKCLNKNSVKLLKFVVDIFVEMMSNKNILTENYIKIIFEKIIHIYGSNCINNNKNNEKKKLYTRLITFIYSIIEDNITTIKHNIKIVSFKDIDNLLQKVKKNQNFNYRLYQPVEGGLDQDQTTATNNTNNYNSENNDRSYYTNNTSNINEMPNNSNKQNNNNIKNNKNNNNNNNNESIPEEVNDLNSVLPNDFFEYHFIVQFQEKMNVLENVNRILPKIKSIKDKDNKNFTDIYKMITIIIEDSNILIHLEGIKILGNICRLLNNEINIQKLKNILEGCFNVFKDKKSIVKNELFNLFDCIILNDCLNCDGLLSFMINFCLTNQKKLPSIVKQNIFEYLKFLFKNNNSIIKNQINNAITDKHYLNFTKNIVEIIHNESVSNIKDLCSDVLIMIKNKIKSSEDQFNNLIQNLPNYRKKIINTNNTMHNNINNYNNINDSSNYKKNLKKIKSSYSYIQPQRGNKSNRSNSSKKDNNLNHSKLDSSFRGGNNKLNTSMNSHNTSFSCNKKDNNKNIKSTKALNKIKSNKNLNKINNNKNNNNIKIIKKDFDNEIDNNNNVENDINSININNNKNDDVNNISSSTNTKTTTDKKEAIEQKKEDVLNVILSKDKKSLEKYSKNLVKDFLFFVNRVSNGELNENLGYHFKVIFNILEKILERILELIKEENAKINENNALIIKANEQILEGLIKRIIKIVVIVPCISEFEGSEELDKNIFNTLLMQLKNNSKNKEIFYINILSLLIQFSNKGKGFLEKIDPKPSLHYFLNMANDGYYEIKSNKIAEVLNCFLNETNLLTPEEKQKYYVNLFNTSNEESRIMQKIDDDEEEEAMMSNKNIINNNNDDNIHQKDECKIIDKKIDINDLNNNDKDECNDKDEYNDKSPLKENNNNANNNDEYLAKRIKESQKLISEKEMENQQLKDLISKYEERRKNFLARNNIVIDENNKEDNNNKDKKSTNNTSDLFDNKINNQSNKLNIINDSSIINNNDISMNDKNNNSSINSNRKVQKSDLQRLIQANKERILNTVKSTSSLNSKSFISSNNDSSKESIMKIKEQLNITTKKLGIALQRMVQQTESKEKDLQLSKINANINKNINEDLTNNNSPNKQDNNLSNNNFTKSNTSTISNNNNNYFDQSEIKNTFNKINNLSELLNININNNNNVQQPQYKELINKLINVLENKTLDDNIFTNLTLQYKKLLSANNKLEYIQSLRSALDNISNFQKVPLNLFLQFYDFLLNILSHEILLNSKDETVIVHLQEIAEHLMKFRNLTDMFKLMLFLLKKYFPKNLNDKITDIALVLIKIITYLTKELLKVLNNKFSNNKFDANNSNSQLINSKDILGEINDLFLITPPSTLTTLTPNATLYQNVFKVLKSLTDEIFVIYKNDWNNIIQDLLNSKIPCEEYIFYLQKLSK